MDSDERETAKGMSASAHHSPAAESKIRQLNRRSRRRRKRETMSELVDWIVKWREGTLGCLPRRSQVRIRRGLRFIKDPSSIHPSIHPSTTTSSPLHCWTTRIPFHSSCQRSTSAVSRDDVTSRRRSYHFSEWCRRCWRDVLSTTDNNADGVLLMVIKERKRKLQQFNFNNSEIN